MTTENIIHKINSLLNKTMENGATEAEADAALGMAQKLMEKHMIEQSQLAEHVTDKTCKKITIPIFKTAYDTTYINRAIADAFDCKNWWNKYHGEVYFFGFAEDAKLAAYFYNYLNNVIVNESEKYKKSAEYAEQKEYGYHGKTLLSSFRKGMMSRLCYRLHDLKESRVSNIVQSTGTDLVVIKDQHVDKEYKELGLKLTTHRSPTPSNNAASYHSGVDKADKINMVGGIENEETKQIA